MLVTQSVTYIGISVTTFVYLFYKEGVLGGSQINLTFLVWVCFCGSFSGLVGWLVGVWGVFCLVGGFGCWLGFGERFGWLVSLVVGWLCYLLDDCGLSALVSLSVQRGYR